MISDRLFVYGTLMRGFDHPMAKLLSRSADFLGEATCRGRLYLVKHYPGLVLSDNTDDIVFGELYRLRARDELLGEFDMYEACGTGFRRVVFEPGQEVKGRAEVAAVIELAGDGGEIFHAGGDVLRLVLKNPPPLLLGQVPPGLRLLDRDQGCAGCFGAAEAGLHGDQ